LKILIFSDWYAPAFKAGGPIRSIVNFVETFKNDFDIHVFTSDRDLGDDHPFSDKQTDIWIDEDRFKIMYASPGNVNYSAIKKIINSLAPDWIYLNSMFSSFTIYPLMVSSRSGKIVLAPRGMLRHSALAIKPIRKYFYLTLLKMLNLDQHIRFHSTSEEETISINHVFPNAPDIVEVPNVLPKINQELSFRKKEQGKLNMIFVGRMHPIKNLIYLLNSLEHIDGNCSLTIIATREDERYSQECYKIITRLKNISTNIIWDLPHHEIDKHLKLSDLFVLPTKGENFGHAIFEALSVGCPVLISDQTPWKNLNQKMAGMEISLDNPSQFASTIQEFVNMNDDEWQEYRMGALQLAQHHLQESNVEMLYFQLFKSKIS
jgi:glycosyltransferase involved in cell wall biosynthesis